MGRTVRALTLASIAVFCVIFECLTAVKLFFWFEENLYTDNMFFALGSCWVILAIVFYRNKL